MSDWNARLELYDQAVAACPRFERKGKTMIYTSANGYMFTLLNKAGEIGVRLSADGQAKFAKTHEVKPYLSYGAVMRDYVLIPDEMLGDLSTLATLMNESYDYVMSLKPNPTNPKKK